MGSGIPLPLFLIIGLIIGIGLVYYILRLKRIRLNKLDEKTLLLRLPLLGTIEAEEPSGYRCIFVKDVS